jgi:hypothetical protein
MNDTERRLKDASPEAGWRVPGQRRGRGIPDDLVLVEGDGRWLLAGWHASPIAGAPSFLNR